jgi:site-specific recombinase XerC
MGKQDSLIIGLHRAVKGSGGSFLTKHCHLKEGIRFVKTLRSLGYGVQKWSKINNRHVQAVVTQWQKEGLSNATLKEYMSGVRLISRFYGGKVSVSNDSFGIGRRVYVSNRDKSVPFEIYSRVTNSLKNSEDINERIVGSQLNLQYRLGLRKEESFKFDPTKAVLQNGSVLIQDGTKGGRERIIFQVSTAAQETIEKHKQYIDRRNSIPSRFSEKTWERFYYRTLEKFGLTKSSSGVSGHGLRHAYAQNRYKEITGFDPPVKHENREGFIANAQTLGGENWHEKDRDARQILMAEMGHGGSRNDVISQYIGSYA